MHVSSMFPDLGEIRRLVSNADSAYSQQSDTRRDLGRALELICKNLDNVSTSSSLWRSTEVALPISVRLREQIASLLQSGRESDSDAFSLIGQALDTRGWPRPPSAEIELRSFQKRAAQPVLRTDVFAVPLQEDARIIAAKACRVAAQYRGEFRRQQLAEERRGRFLKVAKRSSACLLVILAYTGGVNDVPEAYGRLSDISKAVYEYVLGLEVERANQQLELAERELQLTPPEPHDSRFRQMQISEWESAEQEPDDWEPEA